MTLTREQILVAQDLRHEEVKVPEWGGTVFVYAMTGNERDAFEQREYEARGKDDKANLIGFRARLAAATIRGDDGRQLFSPDDVAALGGKSAKALERIVNVAQRLNAISADDVEELTKNSEAGQSAGSTSVSPDTSA